MGASNTWLTPDAIVLPPWETNVEYIKRRQETNYDGGLTMNQLDQLKSHRDAIEELAKKKNVPVFESIQEATKYIEEEYVRTVPSKS